jgi:protein SCO1/2
MPPLERQRRVLFALAALVFLFVAPLIIERITRPYSFHGLQYDPPQRAVDFALTNQDGERVRLSGYRGKLVLLFFGYTHCPDVCPTTFAIWKRAQNLLQSDAEQVRFVFISVDPERDTPERIKAHLSLFSPSFIGLTGSLDEIEGVARSFGAYFKKEDIGSAAGYSVAHTALTLVIDPSGNLVLAFPYGTPAEEIAADVRHLLKR